jgi:hypothetical protein
MEQSDSHVDWAEILDFSPDGSQHLLQEPFVPVRIISGLRFLKLSPASMQVHICCIPESCLLGDFPKGDIEQEHERSKILKNENINFKIGNECIIAWNAKVMVSVRKITYVAVDFLPLNTMTKREMHNAK